MIVCVCMVCRAVGMVRRALQTAVLARLPANIRTLPVLKLFIHSSYVPVAPTIHTFLEPESYERMDDADNHDGSSSFSHAIHLSNRLAKLCVLFGAEHSQRSPVSIPSCPPICSRWAL